MSNPNETKGTSASTETPAAPKAPKFSIVADSPRELALKMAQLLLKTGQFELRTTDPKNPKAEKSKYMLWNLDDSGKISGYNDSLTLTPEEAKMFPTTEGLPIVFSSSFVLRQLTPPAAVAAKLAERRVQTATRDANKAAGASTSALLDELNKRRVAQGLEPITE